MILNTPQVAEKLGVTSAVIHNMVRLGVLKSLNEKKDGQKKVFYKFDSVAVNEFKKTHKRVGRTWYKNEDAPKVSLTPKGVAAFKTTEFQLPELGLSNGLITRLDRIETLVNEVKGMMAVLFNALR